MATAQAQTGPGFESSAHRTIVSPEGVELGLELASRGERLAAILIDLVIIAVVIGLLTALQIYLHGAMNYRTSDVGGWLSAATIVSSFIVRSLYFCFFELRWQGRTPGKRLLGIRVVDRRGGPLLPAAVFARNLTREVELFIPLNLMLAVNFVERFEDLEMLLPLGWIAVFVLMPVLNADRLRVGDLIAGTWVVESPKPALQPDLTDEFEKKQRSRWRGTKKSDTDGIAFTKEQLDVYGEYELQTLEAVLRRGGRDDSAAFREIASRIQKKIGWHDSKNKVAPRVFLESYYAALRKHLESKLVLGERRRDKHHAKDDKAENR